LTNLYKAETTGYYKNSRA